LTVAPAASHKAGVRARVRSAASADRRKAILDAALACFLERGIAATTTEEIRDRSGASIGSIYHHFGDKEGIAGALYLEGLRSYQEGFLSRQKKARPGIEGVVRYHLRWVEEHRELARYVFAVRELQMVGAAREEVAELNRRFYGAVAAWVTPHMQARVLRTLSADLLQALWFGPAQHMARLWLAGLAPSGLARAGRLLPEAAWQTLKNA
jgi:AcrR family transcriptional regulator